MAEVDVVVAGRTYRLGCEDGQEGHLAALAATLDVEARSIAARTGAMGEGKLLLMVALIMADRLHDATAAAPPNRPSAPPLPTELGAALDRLEALLETEACEHDGGGVRDA